MNTEDSKVNPSGTALAEPPPFKAHEIVLRGSQGFITCGDNEGSFGFVPATGNTIWGNWERVRVAFAAAGKPILTSETITRDSAITEIKKALKARSGKAWSVTGGRGTAWGWITVDVPPARRTAHWVQRAGTAGDPGDYDNLDTGLPNGHITPAEAAELANLLGLDTVHHQGVSIPASSAYYAEYVARARGVAPTVKGEVYWD